MEKVKFYSKGDMASGHNLEKAKIIIDKFNINKEYKNINEIIEFYNIYLYIKNGVFLKCWSGTYIKNANTISQEMKSLVYKWFSNNINDKTILSEYKKVIKIYKSDFFAIFNTLLDKIIIKSKIFNNLINTDNFNIYNILKYKNIINKYDKEIKNFMIKDIENSAEVLVDIYLIKNSKYKLYLPASLSKCDKENIITNYVDSENANINYLRLLVNTPDDKNFSLNARTKLKIKNKIEEKEEELFNGSSKNEISHEFFVQIVPNLQTPKKEIFTNDKYELSYDQNWIKDNQDFPTLLNNYIYLFDYVDKQMRWSSVAKKSDLGFVDGHLTMHAKDDYIRGFTFQSNNLIADMQQCVYYDFLNKINIRLEEIIEWFFNAYLKNEFNIDDYRVSMPSKDDKFLAKCRFILPEIEGALKKYNFYVEDGYINHELIDISSTPIPFENIKSLIKNKYVYPCNENDDYVLITYALFSNQCMLGYVERIGEKYSTFFELLTKEKITINDIDEYDKSLFDKLVEYDLLYIDKNNVVKIKDLKSILILKDIYTNEVISYWKVSYEYRKLINILNSKRLVKFDDTLLSKSETDYLNFYLNRKKFINSLDLKNKYDHGTKSSGNEKEHYKNYMILLRLFILVIIKINDDLCIYESQEYKNNQNN